MANYLPLKMKGESRLLLTSSICYIAQSERKVALITDDGDYFIYGCVGDLDSYLDSNFEHARKYMVVNFKKVKSMENCKVEFFNGTSIYLGKTNFNKLKKKYDKYIEIYKNNSCK